MPLSLNCGFCSSEIFRKGINTGRNENSASHYSLSWTWAPAEQSEALFLMITPRFSWFMPLFPLSSLLRNLSFTLSPSHSHLSRTSYNANSQKCVFLPPRWDVFLFWTPRVPFSILLITFFIVYHKGWLNAHMKESRDGEKEKKKRWKQIQGIMDSRVEITFVSLESLSLLLCCIFWAFTTSHSLFSSPFMGCATSSVPQLLPFNYDFWSIMSIVHVDVSLLTGKETYDSSWLT